MVISKREININRLSRKANTRCLKAVKVNLSLIKLI